MGLLGLLFSDKIILTFEQNVQSEYNAPENQKVYTVNMQYDQETQQRIPNAYEWVGLPDTGDTDFQQTGIEIPGPSLNPWHGIECL
jgi:hypothetical protein